MNSSDTVEDVFTVREKNWDAPFVAVARVPTRPSRPRVLPQLEDRRFGPEFGATGARRPREFGGTRDVRNLATERGGELPATGTQAALRNSPAEVNRGLCRGQKLSMKFRGGLDSAFQLNLLDFETVRTMSLFGSCLFRFM